jgi:type II secretory pathway pseudopilin PulG
MVVISLIGILMTLALTSYQGTQKQARDTRRKSDLKQYQTALEAYANSHDGLFLVETSAVDPSTLCSELTGSATGCSQDPKEPDYSYSYCSDSNGIRYVLWASLEFRKRPWELLDCLF